MPAPPRPPAELGDLVEDYELLGELGRGGSAVVYLARDRTLGRHVAVKVVHPRATSPDDDPVARLAREARTVAQLQHPNIVAVYAVRRLQGGGLALIMQFVPGATLKSVIQRSGPLPADRVEAVLRDVAAALAYAHARGLVHRDVKPENIFLNEQSGRALLADFGIARSVGTDSMTRTGTAVGTPVYMSPEQVDGGVIDGRSDLYSLGLVAWEALTGRRPWDGESLYSVIYKQKRETLPPIEALRPGVPRRLQYVVERMLQKRPGARWAGAEGLLAQLDHAVLPADYAQWLRALPDRVARVHASAAPGLIDPTPAASAPATGPASDVTSTVQFIRDADRADDSATNASDVGGHSAPAARAAVRAALDDAEVRPAPQLERDARQPLYPDAETPSWVADSIATPGIPAAHPAHRLRRTVAAAAGAVLVVALGHRLLTGPDDAAAPTPRRLPATPARDQRPQAPVAGVATTRPRLAAGGRHTCMLTSAGEAFCWGADERGQIGDGLASAAVRPPTPVAGVLRFAAVATGLVHTCALTTANDVYCWGANGRGQLGDATAVGRNAPVRIAGSGAFTAVAVGAAHSCAVAVDGSVQCWGANDQGQLGDGSRTTRVVPTRTALETPVVQVAAGGQHTCAVAGAGTLSCWGANADGQLGTGGRTPAALRARAVRLPTPVITAAAGLAHTCVLTRDGAVWCWGRNDSGQLGDGTRQPHASPAQVRRPAGASPFVALSSGAAHVCATDAAGALWCWGRNARGAVGDGTTADRLTPNAVRLVEPVVAAAAGTGHTCATLRDARTLCWGDNRDGQLGEPRVTSRSAPSNALVAVPMPAPR